MYEIEPHTGSIGSSLHFLDFHCRAPSDRAPVGDGSSKRLAIAPDDRQRWTSSWIGPWIQVPGVEEASGDGGPFVGVILRIFPVRVATPHWHVDRLGGWSG